MDFGDPAFFSGKPDAALARLRRRSPVHWDEESGCWIVTGHRDIAEISRDPERFSSSRGVLLSDRNRAVSAEDSLLYLDPPLHAQYRKLVNRAFTPRRVADLEPRVRELTTELLERIDPRRPTDLVEALAAPLPLLVIAELLGLPASDRADFRRWSDAIMEAATNLTDDNAALSLELIGYLQRHLEARRTLPSDDLLGFLMTAEVDGKRLSDKELVGFCMTLLVAGNETTRSMLTGGLVALAEHPDQRAALAEHPELIADAVEEMLRWVTPIMAMARTTTCPVALAGQPVGEGEYLAMVYAAANRDEEAFGETADRFDATRSPNPHLAFGFGEHFCIGAGLARLEGRVAVSEVLARWPDYKVVGPVERAPSTLLRQVRSVAVLFVP
ncbi:MAG: cytochrome P450 [Acidimicrobiales bacterium]